MTTLAEAKAKAAAEAAEDTGRVAPPVQKGSVRRNRAGSVYCEWDVRFPEFGIADDLKEPGIWRKVQDDINTALKRFDEVRILAFDASWVAYAIVAHASQTEVLLAVRGITSLPEARENLYQDDKYRVEFDGWGYVVVRKGDGQKMSDSLVNPALAQQAVINLYPKRVA